MPCGTLPVLVQVQVTLPPAATVSTAGLTEPLRALFMKLLPTITATSPLIGVPPPLLPPVAATVTVAAGHAEAAGRGAGGAVARAGRDRDQQPCSQNRSHLHQCSPVRVTVTIVFLGSNLARRGQAVCRPPQTSGLGHFPRCVSAAVLLPAPASGG